MTVSEEARRELHVALEQSLGREAAATMMELLPPVGWADVATRRDLDRFELAIRSELHTEVAALRDELHRETAGLRDELHTGLGDVRAEIAGLRGELHTEVAALRGDVGASTTSLRAEVEGLRAEMERTRHELLAAFYERVNAAVISQTRMVIAAMLTYFIAVIGLVFGLVR